MKITWICLVFVFSCLILPLTSAAEKDLESSPMAAFTRYHSLWLYKENTEAPIHENINIHNMSWSFDGEWLAYEASPVNSKAEVAEIWLYHASTNEKVKLKINGRDPMWNPVDHTLAFLSESILCVVDLTSNSPVIHQLTGGVSNFTWDAAGINLIASASAALFPDGWSHPRLYEVHWGVEKEAHELDVKVTPLHTVSSPLKYENLSILAVDVKNFDWSNDGKSLAMVVAPTASWSADSNMLSVYVKENKLFIPLGEVLLDSNWLKWAPSKPLLASIQGGGRLTSGVKNKVLTTSTIIPNYKRTYTPEGFADVDFDWLDDSKIVVARGAETKDNNEKFRSSLQIIDIKEKKVSPVVSVPDGSSDGKPFALKNGKQIAWIREDEDGRRHIWISTADGTDARRIVENVFEAVWFGK
jgi:hypothetical protein